MPDERGSGASTGDRGHRPARSGDQTVLDGVDLRVAEGTVLALLGPNGAGKTTTVYILSTLLSADGGEVRVAGHDPARDPDAVRATIGVNSQPWTMCSPARRTCS